MISPLVQDLFDGVNGTCLAYGQTGSGKTYTMGTGNPGQDDLQASELASHHHLSNSWENAVLTRSIEAVFEQVSARRLSGQWSVNVAVSFSEVYMDKLYDLLEPTGNDGTRRPCRPDTLRHPLVRDQESLQVATHTCSTAHLLTAAALLLSFCTVVNAYAATHQAPSVLRLLLTHCKSLREYEDASAATARQPCWWSSLLGSFVPQQLLDTTCCSSANLISVCKSRPSEKSSSSQLCSQHTTHWCECCRQSFIWASATGQLRRPG